MNSEQPLKHEKTADALIEAIRQANRKRPPDPGDACEMANKVMAYALDEVESRERAEIKAHLITCRACMDLYFDARMSQEQAQASSRRPPPMSSALRAAIQEQSTLDSVSPLQKIAAAASHYLSLLTTPQRWAATMASLVMACLVFYYWMGAPGALTADIAMTAKPMTVRSASSQEASHPVRAGDTLMTSDRFQVTITTDEDVYGYVILAGESGRIKTLFRGEFKADKAKQVPDSEKWEKLDHHTGTERIYLIAAKEPILDFDQKIKILKSGEAQHVKALFGDAALPLLQFEHE